jgi:hypothetical protein
VIPRLPRQFLEELQGVRLETVFHHDGRTVAICYRPLPLLQLLGEMARGQTVTDARALRCVCDALVELDGRPFSSERLERDSDLIWAAVPAIQAHLTAWGRRAGFKFGFETANGSWRR